MNAVTRAMSRAFSLIELLVVMVVVCLGMLPVLTAFHTTGETIKQTGPYSQAVFLTEKALEHARLGSTEDPYFLRRLVDEGLGAASQPVVHGQHPFFALFEDTAAPLGRIEAGVDTAIEPELGPLFRQTDALNLALQTTLLPAPTTGKPEAVTLATFQWTDQRSRPMTYAVATPLRMWSPLAHIEAPGPPLADKDLGAALGGTSLAAVAAQRGANAAKLGSYAQLLVLGGAGVTVLAQVQKDVATAGNTPPPDPQARADALVAVARLHEAAAASLLGLLQSMRPAVEDLARDLPPTAFGSPAPDRTARLAVIEALKVTQDGFTAELRAAIQAAMALANADRLNTGVRLSAHQRLVRCLALEALTLPWPDRAPLDQLLGQLAEFYRGRMPNIEHGFTILKQELPSLEVTYPMFPAVEDLRGFRSYYTLAAMRVLLYGVTL